MPKQRAWCILSPSPKERDVSKWISLLSVVVLSAVAVSAQDAQRFETFGGYSLTHDASFLAATTNGWDTSTTIFLKRWLGFTTDVSGHYGSGNFPFFIVNEYPLGKYKLNTSSYTYMAGPHFTYRRSRYAPFVESLFGVYNARYNLTVLEGCPPESCIGPAPGSTRSDSYTKFALAAGGGLDVAVGHGISVRPFQMEYLLLREPRATASNGDIVPITTNYNTYRFSTGISFQFGPHVGSSR
jgi:opacity protein-like surface antigen